MKFDRAGDERSTGANLASIQTDGSFLGLSSGGIKTPSTVSKSAKTKFHDQASLLAMVSEQISKRLSTTAPSENPTMIPSVSQRRRSGFLKERMPFTGPASAWGQPPLKRVNVFLPGSTRPPTAVRVDLPPPPIDPRQQSGVQPTIGVNPRVEQFPEAPAMRNDITQNTGFDISSVLSSKINDPLSFGSSKDVIFDQSTTGLEMPPRDGSLFDNQAQPHDQWSVRQTTGSGSWSETGVKTDLLSPQTSNIDRAQHVAPAEISNFDLIGTTLSPALSPDGIMSQKATMNGTSFFLDPIPTEPVPTSSVTDIRFDISGTTVPNATGQSLADTSVQPTELLISSASSGGFVDPPQVISDSKGNLQAELNYYPQNSLAFTSTTEIPQIKQTKTDSVKNSQIVNISIVDVTNSTVSNESAIQYDMSPFQNNENWAIFDPSLPVNVNFSDYGPILDIPIDTKQISFTSNSESSFSSVFSQASPGLPSPSVDMATAPPSRSSTNGESLSMTKGNVNQMLKNGRKPSRKIKRTEIIRTDSSRPSNANFVSTNFPRGPVSSAMFSDQSMDSMRSSQGMSQRPIDLPPPPF